MAVDQTWDGLNDSARLTRLMTDRRALLCNGGELSGVLIHSATGPCSLKPLDAAILRINMMHTLRCLDDSHACTQAAGAFIRLFRFEEWRQE